MNMRLNLTTSVIASNVDDPQAALMTETGRVDRLSNPNVLYLEGTQI